MKRKCNTCNNILDIENFYYRNEAGVYRRDCKKCTNKRCSKRQKDIGYDNTSRSRHYKNRYGINLEEYEKILKDQKGVCAICKKSEKCSTKKRLHVDHCHDTNEIRGLLCHHCNVALGNFKDDLDMLENAAVYLINFLSYLNPCEDVLFKLQYNRDVDNIYEDYTSNKQEKETL